MMENLMKNSLEKSIQNSNLVDYRLIEKKVVDLDNTKTPFFCFSLRV